MCGVLEGMKSNSSSISNSNGRKKLSEKKNYHSPATRKRQRLGPENKKDSCSCHSNNSTSSSTSGGSASSSSSSSSSTTSPATSKLCTFVEDFGGKEKFQQGFPYEYDYPTEFPSVKLISTVDGSEFQTFKQELWKQSLAFQTYLKKNPGCTEIYIAVPGEILQAMLSILSMDVETFIEKRSVPQNFVQCLFQFGRLYKIEKMIHFCEQFCKLCLNTLEQKVDAKSISMDDLYALIFIFVCSKNYSLQKLHVQSIPLLTKLKNEFLVNCLQNERFREVVKSLQTQFEINVLPTKENLMVDLNMK